MIRHRQVYRRSSPKIGILIKIDTIVADGVAGPTQLICASVHRTVYTNVLMVQLIRNLAARNLGTKFMRRVRRPDTSPVC